MFSPLDHFSTAYQQELLRKYASQKTLTPVKTRKANNHILAHSLARFGDALIALGEKIKSQGDCACVDFSESRA